MVRADVEPRILRNLVIGALNSTSTTSPVAIKDLDVVTDAMLTLLCP